MSEIKDATNVAGDLFIEWVKTRPEVHGLAIIFGACGDGEAVSTVIGGHVANSPAYDRIIMRIAFNVETNRHDTVVSSEEIELG